MESLPTMPWNHCPPSRGIRTELADPLHGCGRLAVGLVRLAFFQRALERGLGPLAPLLEPEHRQAEFAGEQLGGLAAHQPQHHLALAARAPALAGRQWARCDPTRGRRGALARGQRGRATPDPADHGPTHRLITSVLIHAALHHAGLRSDKWLSRKTGGSSRGTEPTL